MAMRVLFVSCVLVTCASAYAMGRDEGATPRVEKVLDAAMVRESNRIHFPSFSLSQGLDLMRQYARDYPMEVLAARISIDSAGEKGVWTKLLVGTQVASLPPVLDEMSEFWSALRTLRAESRTLNVNVYHTHPSEYVRRLARDELMRRERAEARYYGLTPSTFDPGQPFGTPPSPNDITALRAFARDARKIAERMSISIDTMEGVIDETGQWRYSISDGGECEIEAGASVCANVDDLPPIRYLQVKWAKFINRTPLQRAQVLASREYKRTVAAYGLHGIRLSFTPFD